MASIQALREQRVKIANKMKALVESDQEWTKDRDAEFSNMKVEIEQIDNKISALEQVLRQEEAEAAAVSNIAGMQGVSVDQAQAVRDLDKSMFAAWARDGRDGLDQEMSRIQDARLLAVRNEMSTGRGEAGGYVVAPEFARTLLEVMKAGGAIRNVATVMQTQTGTTIPYPTTDATSEEGELVPENGSATDEDGKFGTKALATYKFSSKVFTVPFELLQDSAIDLEGHIRSRLDSRLRRTTERYFLLGTDEGQPGGLLTQSKVGIVGQTGKAGVITYEDLLRLKHSVDPAYRQTAACRYMFNDQTLLALKLLKDNEGRPIWLPGVAVGAPDTIDGNGFEINQFMPGIGANNKSMLFGDLSRYVVRDVMQILLLRFTDSVYAKKGQVGFLGWMRSGGNLMDVGGAVKAYQHAAS